MLSELLPFASHRCTIWTHDRHSPKVTTANASNGNNTGSANDASQNALYVLNEAFCAANKDRRSQRRIAEATVGFPPAENGRSPPVAPAWFKVIGLPSECKAIHGFSRGKLLTSKQLARRGKKKTKEIKSKNENNFAA